jgi:hypothetical protein
VDFQKNPFQDCLNTIGKICNATDMETDKSRIIECKNAVDEMTQSMSHLWQNVRKECGQWMWKDQTIGNLNSVKCADANSQLEKNAYYIARDVQYFVTSPLTKSISRGLWSNPNLQQ